MVPHQRSCRPISHGAVPCALGWPCCSREVARSCHRPFQPNPAGIRAVAQGCEVPSLPGPGGTCGHSPRGCGSPCHPCPDPVFQPLPSNIGRAGAVQTLAEGPARASARLVGWGFIPGSGSVSGDISKCSRALGSSALLRCCLGVYLLAAVRGRYSPCPSHRLLGSWHGHLGECPCRLPLEAREGQLCRLGWQGVLGLCLGRAELEEK